MRFDTSRCEQRASQVGRPANPAINVKLSQFIVAMANTKLQGTRVEEEWDHDRVSVREPDELLTSAGEVCLGNMN